MVHRQQQHVVVRRHAHQPPAEQRAPRQVERRARLVLHQAAQLAPPRPPRHGGRAPPAGTRSPRPGRCAGPARRPPSEKVVRSASWRATMRSSARTSAPRSRRAPQPQAHGDVVGRAHALHLLEEPQPLLRERQRKRPGALHAARSPSPRHARRSRSPRAKSASTGRSNSVARSPPPRPAPAAPARSPAPPAASARPARRSCRGGPPAPRPAPRPRSRPAPPRSRPPAPRTRGPHTRRPPARGAPCGPVLPFGVSGNASIHTYAAGTMYSGRRSARCAFSASTATGSSAQVVRHQPPVAGRVLARRGRPERARPGAPPAAPRSRPARCGSRAPSPGSRCGPGTRVRQCVSA